MSQEQAVDFLSLHCKLGIQLKYSVVLLKMHLEVSVRTSSFPKNGVTLPAERFVILLRFPLLCYPGCGPWIEGCHSDHGVMVGNNSRLQFTAEMEPAQCSCTCEMREELGTQHSWERTKINHAQPFHCWLNWRRRMDQIVETERSQCQISPS